MRKSPPLALGVEALLAPHRGIVALAPSVAARAIARAAAVSEAPEPVAVHTVGRSQRVFAAAAGVVLALGAAAYAGRIWSDTTASPRPVVAPVTATDSLPRALAPNAADVDVKGTSARRAAPPVRRVASRPSMTAVNPTNAELQLLRQARQDLTRGDFAGAMAAAGEHARRFRNGALVEEREALRVKSLAGLGRVDDARRAAAEFHARFPHSVLLPTFERMTEPVR
jgi:hypothetical protein